MNDAPGSAVPDDQFLKNDPEPPPEAVCRMLQTPMRPGLSLS